MGVPLNHPNRIFPYEPSILGYPHLWKTQLDSGKIKHVCWFRSRQITFPDRVHGAEFMHLIRSTRVPFREDVELLWLAPSYLISHMEVSWNRGIPSHHPFLDGIFPYKPSYWGIPHLCKPPYLHQISSNYIPVFPHSCWFMMGFVLVRPVFVHGDSTPKGVTR